MISAKPGGDIHALRAGHATLRLTAQGQLAFHCGAHRWENHGVLAVLHYYDRQHPRAQSVAVPRSDSFAYGTPGTLSSSCRSSLAITPSADDRLDLDLHFDEIGICVGMRLDVIDGGQGLQLTIPDAAVREAQPDLYRVLGIEILPGFGAATTGEEGYLLLPNWFGTQCFFDKHYPREVRQTIYSPNDQWENVCNMPVFGITRGQGTLCGLIAEGDRDAQLVCRQHWEQAQHHSVHPYLAYRWEQQDDLIPGPRRVQYAFAPPDHPDGEGYVFCGKTYRRLLQQRGLQTWKQKARQRPEAIDFAGRLFLKIFMAYKDPQPDGRGAYHVGCTFAEARQIVEDCLARGTTRLAVVLVGWGQDGHDGKYPTLLPPDDRVGGEEGMRHFAAWCRRRDVMLGMHTSHSAVYSCSDEFTLDDVVVHRSGEHWQGIVWSGGRVYRVCPQVSLQRYVRRDLPQLAALGIHGHHHYDAVGGFMLCHAPAHPVTSRSHYIDLVREECRVALRTMGSLSTEMPFGQYFDLMDGFFHSFVHPCPWHLASPVGRHFYDHTVPLLSVVLHGSVNCGEAMRPGRAWQLEALDMGVTPQTEVSMRACRPFGIPAYADRADLIAQTYAFFYGESGVQTRLGGAAIVSRRELAPLVSRTCYDNGMVVCVNRSQTALGALAPMSFTIDQAPAGPGGAEPGDAVPVTVGQEQSLAY